MKAITIKQPWASLIANGIKDIENRTWKTNYRGRVLIHSSAIPDDDPYKIFLNRHLEAMSDDMFVAAIETYKHNSMVIGSVEIVDCVQNDPSIWAEQGVWNWKLANPILFEKPIENVKGKLMFWEYEHLENNSNP